MKIAYFSCSTIYGGVEKIIIETLNELCKDNEILLIVPRGCQYKNQLDSKVTIYEYKSYDKRYNPFLYAEIYKVLKDFSAQILHSHAAKATQIGFVISKFMDFKFIATKHNNRKGKIFNRVKNVICVSKAVANTVNHETKTLYFGIKNQAIKRDLPDIFTITAVGRLDLIKGFDQLIKSVQILDFPFILQIIGDGKEKENLQNLINELSLNDKVKLLGFRSDIAQILANSHLQVISSLKEGFPISLIEGIFYSHVLISTPVGGIVEILDSNFFIENNNFATKIEEIYQNYNDFKTKFAQTHSKFRQILTFENYILNLKNYYKEVK
ncbi:glycosyltransferase, family 1 [Campylobacter iguaniorum]|uniref:Glycosyltransferase, family 1 n=1 Tax=Campylobacter iguaniorum TaxID=1244531 RepID=A0A076FHE6_9BACT|nr:glycosyltransferase [Campylobacter iguaniorum]AII15234.1 glycosyltransferase, family 1 [Campylobacter iguaniorum]